jgi:hypothetical protein
MRNTILLACLIIYGVLTSLLIVRVPIGVAPDEGAHLEYARYLLDKNSLPVFEARGANFPGYEFHQPPLYYGLCALAGRVLQPQDLPFAARFISLVCGALTLVFLWHSLRLLFPDDRVLAPLATGFAALWPLHIGVGASAGNDALVGLMCAGIFWSVARLAARAQKEKNAARDVVLIGVFFGLGMLTKSSCLPVGLAGLGAAMHLARRQSTPFASLRAALIVSGVALLICGAWLARNTMLYGDPLAARIFDEAFKNSSPRPADLMAATGVSLFEYCRAYFLILFATCWGFFGGPNTAIKVLNPFGRGVAPAAFQALPLMLACLAATVLAIWGCFKEKFDGTNAQGATQRIALLWWGVGLLLVCAALFRFNLIQFQAQARYLHPALLPMALVSALGWKGVLGSRRALLGFFVVFSVTLILITLWNALGWQTLV